MVLQMTRPHKNPKTGVFYFRQKVPADLRAAVGKSEVSWSLRTKSEGDAKLRHSEALQKQSLIWQAMRATPEPIPHKQLVALAGVHYRAHVEMLEDASGQVAVWKAMPSLTRIKSGRWIWAYTSTTSG